MEVRCGTCSKKVHRTPWHLKRYSNVYCSRKCRRGTYRRGATRQCQTCSKPFYLFPSQTTADDRAGLFCSRKCYTSEYRSKKVTGLKRNAATRARISAAKKGRPSTKRLPPLTFTCEQCGALTTRPRIGRYVRRFCSTACWYEWLRDDPKRNHLWKGGYEPYYGPNWREQARQARERDGQCCQSCGKYPRKHSLEVHHIVPFRDFPSWREANDLSNLVTLCKSCHSKDGGRGFAFRLSFAHIN